MHSASAVLPTKLISGGSWKTSLTYCNWSPVVHTLEYKKVVKWWSYIPHLNIPGIYTGRMCSTLLSAFLSVFLVFYMTDTNCCLSPWTSLRNNFRCVWCTVHFTGAPLWTVTEMLWLFVTLRLPFMNMWEHSFWNKEQEGTCLNLSGIRVKTVIHAWMSLTALSFHLSYFGSCINKIKNRRNVISKYI